MIGRTELQPVLDQKLFSTLKPDRRHQLRLSNRIRFDQTKFLSDLSGWISRPPMEETHAIMLTWMNDTRKRSLSLTLSPFSSKWLDWISGNGRKNCFRHSNGLIDVWFGLVDIIWAHHVTGQTYKPLTSTRVPLKYRGPKLRQAPLRPVGPLLDQMVECIHLSAWPQRIDTATANFTTEHSGLNPCHSASDKHLDQGQGQKEGKSQLDNPSQPEGSYQLNEWP